MRRYGFYKARTMAKHPASIRPRHLVPAAALVGAAALAVAGFVKPAAWLVLALGAGLYSSASPERRSLRHARSGGMPAGCSPCSPRSTSRGARATLAGLVRYVPARRSMAATGAAGP